MGCGVGDLGGVQMNRSGFRLALNDLPGGALNPLAVIQDPQRCRCLACVVCDPGLAPSECERGWFHQFAMNGDPERSTRGMKRTNLIVGIKLLFERIVVYGIIL